MIRDLVRVLCIAIALVDLDGCADDGTSSGSNFTPCDGGYGGGGGASSSGAAGGGSGGAPAPMCETAPYGTGCAFAPGWDGTCWSETCCWSCARDGYENAPCPAQDDAGNVIGTGYCHGTGCVYNGVSRRDACGK